MQVKSLLTAAAMALLATTAPAFAALELNCDAPRVAIGDDPRDFNPVVSVEVRYIPEDHAWRIFHNRRDGLVVSRSEQYAIQDATNDYKTQWQGSLNRARQLYMVGEVRRVDNGAYVYQEWMYDRSRNSRLVMQSSARCAMADAPLPSPTAPLPNPTAQRPSPTAQLPNGIFE